MNFEITELSDFSGEMAHIYSVTLKGQEQTLLEQFFDDNAEYREELTVIVEKLLVMGNDTGCRYEFFKHHEGALADGVAALRVGQIRLYCLYFDRTAVFFGSGGYKSPEIKAYQEDPELNAKAVQMREIAARINKANDLRSKPRTIGEDAQQDADSRKDCRRHAGTASESETVRQVDGTHGIRDIRLALRRS